jgi:hypothetical protein
MEPVIEPEPERMPPRSSKSAARLRVPPVSSVWPAVWIVAPWRERVPARTERVPELERGTKKVEELLADLRRVPALRKEPEVPPKLPMPLGSVRSNGSRGRC